MQVTLSVPGEKPVFTDYLSWVFQWLIYSALESKIRLRAWYIQPFTFSTKLQVFLFEIYAWGLHTQCICLPSRIHRLLLYRGVRPPPPGQVSWYYTKQSDVPVRLELWGMRSTPSFPSLPDPLGPGVIAPDKSPIYGLKWTKPCFLHNTDFLHLNCVFTLNWIV